MAKAKFTLASNREYWEDPRTISIIDTNLKQLEIEFVSSYLRPHFEIADVGCGDGSATVEYSKRVRQATGVERSRHLLKTARAAQRRSGRKNLHFVSGDILEPDLGQTFDLVVTERVLINLPSWSLQKRAIDNVYRMLKPKGWYVFIENTNDANDVMNGYRKAAGLPPIPKHWHNHFLDLEKFKAYVKPRFRIVERRGFNLYYFLTRVYTQMFASFTGAGRHAKKDPIFEVSDAAARRAEQLWGDRIAFKDASVFGPIQGFALQRRT